MSRVLPILFNTEMVRAILDGRKTCTRRLVKTRRKDACGFYVTRKTDSSFAGIYEYDENESMFDNPLEPPYQPGDILYVRETWMDYAGRTMYRADCDKYRLESLKLAEFSWKPSIHMPKEAARIWLKVTNVSAERLQDITENGAKAEDAKQCYEQINTVEDKPVTYLAEDGKGYYVLGFKSVWNSTIKKSDLDRYGWDANPWVWVIEFERCEKPEGV